MNKVLKHLKNNHKNYLWLILSLLTLLALLNIKTVSPMVSVGVTAGLFYLLKDDTKKHGGK